MWNNQSKICKGKLNEPSQAGGRIFDPYKAHSVSEALLKSGINAAALLGRKGLSNLVKSDFVKNNIKNFANKYVNQAIDSVTTDLSKKIWRWKIVPVVKGKQKLPKGTPITSKKELDKVYPDTAVVLAQRSGQSIFSSWCDW